MDKDVQQAAQLADRGVLAVTGADRVAFLQGLVTNDVTQAAPGRPVYACLLTPQGKFLHDMLIFAEGERLLLETERARVEELSRRLRPYKLRSDVAFEDVSAQFDVWAVWPDAAAPDPRDPTLGSRLLLSAGSAAPATETDAAAFDRHRIALAVPDGSRDLDVGKDVLLEAGIDRLNGIAWDKGCYMGQELTARTRYRGLVKRRLVAVTGEAPLPERGTILTREGREVGEMRSRAGDLGLALVRVEAIEAGGVLEADGQAIAFSATAASEVESA